jgi:hypothetical protein
MELPPTNGNGKIELTDDQIEVIGMFNDLSFENPGLTFEEVVLKEFGCTSIEDLFPPTPWGRLFEKECREVFEMERRE